jgi:N-acetylglucosaminyldiphosphoundecaprenol N-acetyl-beta-D-mannosaminyltransferase
MSSVLGVRIDQTTYSDAVSQILGWARNGGNRYVCVANVHLVMEARDDAEFRRMVVEADLVTPDGMPLVWVLKAKGSKLPGRVYGPTLMRYLLDAAEREGVAVGLYGSTPEVLGALGTRLVAEHPRLNVAFSQSPPFRELSQAEDEAVCDGISASGARVLFVGLGCPKQEKWMAAHRGRVAAVMVGVGAAFDLIARTKRQAPRWMQQLGLEWFFRLTHEPVRLWKRYLYHNPRFVALAAGELLGIWKP